MGMDAHRWTWTRAQPFCWLPRKTMLVFSKFSVFHQSIHLPIHPIISISQVFIKNLLWISCCARLSRFVLSQRWQIQQTEGDASKPHYLPYLFVYVIAVFLDILMLHKFQPPLDMNDLFPDTSIMKGVYESWLQYWFFSKQAIRVSSQRCYSLGERFSSSVYSISSQNSLLRGK